MPTPVTVVGGYLGAGKTTLVNHLLRNARGLRLAILVNDFGAIPIDADLIEAESEDVISIAGGCICCAFGSDLMGALMKLATRDPAPAHVLIETSGVAMPGLVARSAALLRSFSIDGVVVLADAETVRTRAADRYMGDTITRQLEDADIVIVNKSDLVSAGEMAELNAWLSRVTPHARAIGAIRAEVPVEVILGAGHAPGRPAGGSQTLASGAIRSVEPAAARFESASFASAAPVEVTRLAARLAQPACGLVRAKGVLRDADGSLKTLHVVGARYEVRPFAGPDGVATGLACIGLRGRLDRVQIESALALPAPDAPAR